MTVIGDIAARKVETIDGPPGRRVPSLLRSPVFGQAALYAVGNGGVSLLAAAASAVLARHLSTSDFGSFSFAKAFLIFTAMFFDFGLFAPAGRQVALSGGGLRQSIIGAAVLTFMPVAICFCGFVLIASQFINGWFQVSAGSALAASAVLAFAYPLRLLGLQLAQGADILHTYSITVLGAQAAFLAALVGLVAVGIEPSVTSAIVLQSAAFAAGGVWLFFWLRPAFAGARERVRPLVGEARAWGFHLFAGRALSVGTYNMDIIMLGIWADARSVGMYALAGSLASASALPVTGGSIALYPKMVRDRRVDPRWVATAWVAGGASVLVVYLAAGPVIDFVFSSAYHDAAALALPLAIASALGGVTTVYSTFLSANAGGRELRDAGIVLTTANLALNFALIPTFGAIGAAWASAAAISANVIAHVHFYRRAVGRGV